jgi:hypothetical protein
MCNFYHFLPFAPFYFIVCRVLNSDFTIEEELRRDQRKGVSLVVKPTKGSLNKNLVITYRANFIQLVYYII